MIRRVLLIAGLACASVVAFSGPARADYGGCSPAASKTTATAGETITISGTGAEPGGTVTASVDGTQIGSGTATQSGTYSFSAKVPDDATGSVTVSVNCGDGAGVQGLTITVATAGGGLVRTGSSSTIPTTAVGIGLVAVGGLAVGYSRRRRSHSSV